MHATFWCMIPSDLLRGMRYKCHGDWMQLITSLQDAAGWCNGCCQHSERLHVSSPPPLCNQVHRPPGWFPARVCRSQLQRLRIGAPPLRRWRSSGWCRSMAGAHRRCEEHILSRCSPPIKWVTAIEVSFRLQQWWWCLICNSSFPNPQNSSWRGDTF